MSFVLVVVVKNIRDVVGQINRFIFASKNNMRKTPFRGNI
ncbi:hypothetical protein CNEO4_830015 [Clostridium neonatale]|nr:hypothetical protein CNEO4_830015 [Clostridium neonatale]CAI3724580.1 hypothetical protein CNEO4_860011 [Clostridium neonatale]